ncbi:MAG TPA: MFS transporter [Thermomicrobiales bacterium]|nr:MFS transporter [Thermomicrobiales bacterium]
MLPALSLAAFLAALNFFAPTPFFPAMARDLHVAVPLLGQMVTLMVLISAGLGLVVGPVTDRYGYRRPLAIGILAIAANLVGIGLAPAYPVLLAWSVVGGLGDALVFALPLAIAGSQFAGDARRRAIGVIIGSLNTAPILGAPLLTAISGLAGGWRLALVAAGVAAAISAGLVAAALPADERPAAPHLRPRSLLAAYAPLARHWPTLRLYGVAALRAIAWLGVLTYLGAFLGQALGLDTQQIGLVYALAGAGSAVGSVAAGGWLGRISPRGGVAVSSLLAGVLIAPMLMTDRVWVAVPLLLGASFAAAVCGVGVTALLAVESPGGAGTTMVLNGSVLNLGTAVSAVLGGGLIALGGYPALGLALPLFALAAAGLAVWPAARPRERDIA